MVNSGMTNSTRAIAVFVLFSTLSSPLIATATKSQLDLTDSERQWLENNPSVSFTGDPNWLPYEAFDSNGQYIGIVSEHLKLISELSGIQFKMSPSRTWTESTEKAKQGLVDILSETDDSDLKSHLTFTDNYLSNPIVIAMQNDEDYVEGISAIAEQKPTVLRLMLSRDHLVQLHRIADRM